MPAVEFGLKKLLGLHYYVRDLERSRRFYVDIMSFDEVGRSSRDLDERGRQRSLVFRAGEIVITCSTPLGEGGRAARYLAQHPDGIGTIAFEVSDIARAFATLDALGATPISEVQTFADTHGEIATFSITTPFGDTTFRFIETRGYRGLFPGMEVHDEPVGGKNALGLAAIDHVTSNFQTMQPALLWLEHVLGFETFWEVQFHTDDVKHGMSHGSGLRSKVMWHPQTGTKFANNEPYRPAFKSSQINIFHEQHHGDGVQHVALSCADIVGAVRALRARGLEFMPTPDRYYELLPERLAELGIAKLDEDIETLRENRILVDGSGPNSYLFQIFLKDSADLYGSKDAGPFFFELISRKGDAGFGAGNFRALFESIEREQSQRGED